MLKVLFFAQIKERLQCGALELPNTPANLQQLRAELSQRAPVWQEVLEAGSALAAVNQTICPDDMPLKPGDEVAFFPPVTGG